MQSAAPLVAVGRGVPPRYKVSALPLTGAHTDIVRGERLASPWNVVVYIKLPDNCLNKGNYYQVYVSRVFMCKTQNIFQVKTRLMHRTYAGTAGKRVVTVLKRETSSSESVMAQ